MITSGTKSRLFARATGTKQSSAVAGKVLTLDDLEKFVEAAHAQGIPMDTEVRAPGQVGLAGLLGPQFVPLQELVAETEVID